MRVIFISKCKKFRIVEHEDNHMPMDDLKGECFDPKALGISSQDEIKKLKLSEIDFENLVEREGIYFYGLETWDPKPDCGWEPLDAFCGFIGPYCEEHNPHYIVDEFKSRIKDLIKRRTKS